MASINLSSFAGAGAQFFDNNGTPLVGGLLYVYTAGTTTPATTWTSPSGTVANTNPIVLDAGGRTPYEIWVNGGVLYKFVLKTSTGVTIGTYDSIPAIDDPTSFNNLITVTGTNTLIGTSTPPNTAYTRGMTLSFVVVNSNTGAVTLDVDGLGAKEITFGGSIPLSNGQLSPDSIVTIEYDGTRFQLMNSSAGFAANMTSINGGQIAGFRNHIINGNFDIWQRGTSITPALATLRAADMWFVYTETAAPAVVTRAPGPNTASPYCLGVMGAAGNTRLAMGTRIESNNVRVVAGQTVTVSGQILSTDVRSVTVSLSYANTADNFASSSLISTNAIGNTVANNWKSFTTTFTLPAGAANGLELSFGFGATGVGVIVQLAAVQLELGSVATPFEQRLIGTELMLCQRYYQTCGQGFSGACNSTTNGFVSGTFPVTMRTTPTIVSFIAGTGVNALIRAGGTIETVNTVINQGAYTNGAWMYFGGSAYTTGVPYAMLNNMITVSAEL